MRTLKLMADYDCFPLWEASPCRVGNVDPASLPISEALAMQLTVWAQTYDNTLCRNDPIRSGFGDKRAEERFALEGRQLGERLRIELGPDYDVAVRA